MPNYKKLNDLLHIFFKETFDVKSHASSVRDGHFFVKRIVNVWNSLPDSIVMSNSVVAFRHQVAQLSQRDRASGWVSNGQKWKTGTERQYLRTI